MSVKMKLSNITPRKFIESYPGNGRKVLTPSGYAEIIEVHKTIPYSKFEITLENGMKLECAGKHVVIDSDYNECYAKDTLGKEIKTEFGNSIVTSVIDLQIKENMFDISIDSDDELYYSNGILSHNSGKSISTGIYLTHKFIFSKDINIGIVANKGPMAREFLANVKNILVDLPIWVQPGMTTWNKGSIESEVKMRILTDVPSADSFRGFTIALLVIDECVAYKEIITVRHDDTGEIRNMCIGDFYNEIDKQYSVLTQNGFQKFSGIKKTQGSHSLKFTFSDQTDIECSVNHLFLIKGDIFREANLFKIGDNIGDKVITNICESFQAIELFDLLNVENGNHYITSGVTSHNCAFIKPNIWAEFSDSIFPSQSGLAWKKNIILSTSNGINHFYDIVKEARIHKTSDDIEEIELNDGEIITIEEYYNRSIEKK